MFTGAEATGHSITWGYSMPVEDPTEDVIVLSDVESDDEVGEPLRLEDVVRDL